MSDQLSDRELKVSAFVDGELGSEEQKTVAAWLAESSELRRTADEFESLDRLARRLDDAPVVQPEEWADTLSSIRENGGATGVSSARGSYRWMWALAAAALLAITIWAVDRDPDVTEPRGGTTASGGSEGDPEARVAELPAEDEELEDQEETDSLPEDL